MPKKTEPKVGDLRVWHIPQVPGEAFRVPVKTPEEGKLVLDVLAAYDLFQLEFNIKPDYANAGGLEVFDADEGWVEWYDEESGEAVDDCERLTNKVTSVETISEASKMKGVRT